MIHALKSFFQSMPWPVGYVLSKLPYQYRPGLGPAYSMRRSDIEIFGQLSPLDQKQYIFSRVQNSLHKSSSVPFYRDLYASNGIDIDSIRSFQDWDSLPVITKEMLNEYDIKQRSRACKGRYKTNTGGTSGNPLNFYITPELIPNEWAHMHTIWGKLGFRQDHLKLVFAGRNIGSKPLYYDGLRHSYAVNAYKSFDDILHELSSVIRTRNVTYLHGYPSALAEFARNISNIAPDLLEILKMTLRGVFLGSEYPAPIYRQEIENTFMVPIVSWYGHTERAILAWEKHEPYVYHPFQTYGYCEAVKNEETGGWRLVATSYYNFASPFIRYDTGDEIEPVHIEDGILRSFKITAGRVGDFVVDKSGSRISLTALIFGRHHKLFDIARFIQVGQIKHGEMTVFITPKAEFPSEFIFDQWFDRSSLDIEVDYQLIDAPILSGTGKVPLKVKR